MITEAVPACALTGDNLTAGARLRDLIENEILTGALPPGSRLDEVTLATRYGVSRTPIREAIGQLAAAGLVETRPRRGALVAALGPAKLVQMFEVMAELEAMAGRLAARRLTDAAREDILSAHAACGRSAATGDSDAYYYANERFHAAIYAASRNEFLVDQCLGLHRRLKPYRRLQLRVRDRVAASFAEHDEIVRLLLAGEGDQVAARLRDHVTVQGVRFADLVASLDGLHSTAA